VNQPSPVEIVAARPDDAARYAAAAERFFRQTYGHDAAHAAVMEAHCAQTYSPARIAAQIAAPDVTALVALSGAEIVGLAQLHATGSDGEVLRFYLAEEWHGRGLAQALMQAVVSRASVLGITTLRLGVWTGNARAIAFYRRQGFVAAGQVQFFLADVPQSDLMMQRSLTISDPAADL
jgi:diamine N-acetyltransferase